MKKLLLSITILLTVLIVACSGSTQYVREPINCPDPRPVKVQKLVLDVDYVLIKNKDGVVTEVKITNDGVVKSFNNFNEATRYGLEREGQVKCYQESLSKVK